MLEKKENNYIISVLTNDTTLAFTVADVSTGYFAVSQIETEDKEKTLQDELAKLQPSECILPDALYNDSDLLKMLTAQTGLNIFPFSSWEVYAHDAKKIVKKHFGVTTLESFGVKDHHAALQTAAALLGYLKETQKEYFTHKKLTSLSNDDGLVWIDRYDKPRAFFNDTRT
jgi:DNA mismatch repair protein MutS